MKRIIIVLALLGYLKGYAQHADAIVGKWIKTNKEDLIIQVYKVKNEYEGKITWSKDNAKPKGFVMLDNLTYNPESKQWEGGTIHDPKSSRTYDATVAMRPDGTLEVSGKFLFFKSTRTFKRVS
jgi:uncharacterized protein (DUF2147 family)